MLDDAYRGLKVLDLAQGFAGPYCAAILAQAGAEVVKVEPPAGDWSRLMGRASGQHTAMSLASNTGKSGLAVDARRPEGRALLLRLASAVDVVTQSFRPGVAERLGIGFDAIRACNPSVLYVSVSGFGAEGPYRDRPATDTILQAMSGMMVMNRSSTGVPQRIGMLAIDVAAGVYAAQAVGVALFKRARTGEGGHINISLLEVAAAFQAMPILDHAMFGGQPRTALTVPSGTFATADGAINLVSVRDDMFDNLARAVGCSHWVEDARFRTNADRALHADEINGQLERIIREQTTQFWTSRFDEFDVLCAPVNDYAGLLEDPQVAHAEIFEATEITGFDPLPFPRLPGMARAPRPCRPPAIGEHSRGVLMRFGLSPAEIDELVAAGIVIQAER
ncbi:CoA transferase [Methylobacterium sp. J-030]|uniref:CaiB/BaiF CoA transferase family protein n=1 Tax=Methylobacterium sp. J-030 TaxID=2836627 RepID=UPI001FBA37A2|nr:CoA transferase [Methylobacterium sp. J-030]MCJ2072199.1 CoA transferase [Methylobacterium sp. J-030]